MFGRNAKRDLRVALFLGLGALLPQASFSMGGILGQGDQGVLIHGTTYKNVSELRAAERAAEREIRRLGGETGGSWTSVNEAIRRCGNLKDLRQGNQASPAFNARGQALSTYAKYWVVHHPLDAEFHNKEKFYTYESAKAEVASLNASIDARLASKELKRSQIRFRPWIKSVRGKTQFNTAECDQERNSQRIRAIAKRNALRQAIQRHGDQEARQAARERTRTGRVTNRDRRNQLAAERGDLVRRQSVEQRLARGGAVTAAERSRARSEVSAGDQRSWMGRFLDWIQGKSTGSQRKLPSQAEENLPQGA